MVRHSIIGKSVLILALLFSIAVIGENPTYIPRGVGKVSEIDTVRKKSSLTLRQIEENLKPYELIKKHSDK